jgi:flagellin
VVDALLDTISSARGGLGAVQNRLASTVANLGVVSDKVSEARSRVLDADFAAETAALTKSQILQQAGIAILAQANSHPQQVLALLRQ